MNPAFDKSALRSELDVLGGIMLAQAPSPVRCSWCRAEFRHYRDLAAFLDFCIELPRIWPKTQKRLPEGRLFCSDCAVGAIRELVDGVPYAPGRAA